MITGLDLATVKAYLGYADDDTSRDVQLNAFIAAAIATLQRFTGRRFEAGQYRDTLRNRPDRVYLHEWPVISVEEVKVGDSIVDPTEYFLFLADGYIYSKNTCWPHARDWLDGESYFTVLYTANTSGLPPDVYLAVLNAIQAADMDQKQKGTYGGTIKRISVYDVGITDLAVPKEGTLNVMQSTLQAQLADYMSTSGDIGGWRLHECEFIGAVTSP